MLKVTILHPQQQKTSPFAWSLFRPESPRMSNKAQQGHVKSSRSVSSPSNALHVGNCHSTCSTKMDPHLHLSVEQRLHCILSARARTMSCSSSRLQAFPGLALADANLQATFHRAYIRCLVPPICIFEPPNHLGTQKSYHKP